MWSGSVSFLVQWFPDSGCLQLYHVAISLHESSTLLYFLGSIKTDLSTQTRGITVFSNHHPDL